MLPSIIGPVSLVGEIWSVFSTWLLVEKMKSNDMAITWIMIAKAVLDVPCMLMIFYQQSNFWLSVSGLITEYLVAQGWIPLLVIIIKEAVDPKLAQLAISLIFLTGTIS
jgi:hypothetical protein